MFILLTAGPAMIVGGGLWYFAGTLPSCEVKQAARLASPDNIYDLVVFSRDCGTTTGANTQAALVPKGDEIAEDATSFFSVGATADLAARWDAYGNIELTVPTGAKLYRNDDSVAGIDVIYR